MPIRTEPETMVMSSSDRSSSLRKAVDGVKVTISSHSRVPGATDDPSSFQILTTRSAAGPSGHSSTWTRSTVNG